MISRPLSIPSSSPVGSTAPATVNLSPVPVQRDAKRGENLARTSRGATT